MIGNDVVDLGDPMIAEHHLRPRFCARVLSEGERARLVSAADPKKLLWTLFAAKEAAFKVVEKLRGPTVFAHRSFVVAEDLRSVAYDGLRLELAIEAAEDQVHALAWTTGADTLHGVDTIQPSADPSLAARAGLLAALSQRLGCALAELEIVRAPAPDSWTGRSPPQLHRRGTRSPVDVSR